VKVFTASGEVLKVSESVQSTSHDDEEEQQLNVACQESQRKITKYHITATERYSCCCKIYQALVKKIRGIGIGCPSLYALILNDNRNYVRSKDGQERNYTN
jgi:DNA topoisomerase IA